MILYIYTNVNLYRKEKTNDIRYFYRFDYGNALSNEKVVIFGTCNAGERNFCKKYADYWTKFYHLGFDGGTGNRLLRGRGGLTL